MLPSPVLGRYGGAVSSVARPVVDHDDDALLDRFLLGDEAAFDALISRHGGTVQRIARRFSTDPVVAEEIAQETWLAVLRGLERFEGRSSFRTWLISIALNRARSHRDAEARSVPFSALARRESESDERAVEPESFLPAHHDRQPRHWSHPLRAWDPSTELLATEARDVLVAAVAALPHAQRTVVVMRDVLGHPAHEVCGALGLTEGNQRVLLHRGRSRLRAALDSYISQPAA
jgi:RNA polymerase sigma-70 factor (ECF subfamily)